MLHMITQEDIDKQKRLIYAAQQAFETLAAIQKYGAMEIVAQRDLRRLKTAILDIDPAWKPIMITHPEFHAPPQSGEL